MKNIFIIFGLFGLCFLAIGGCTEERQPDPKVPLNQLNPDNSTNYRFIFRKEIYEQDRQERQYQKDPFEK